MKKIKVVQNCLKWREIDQMNKLPVHCSKYKIIHIDLFEENGNAIFIRTSSEFRMDKDYHEEKEEILIKSKYCNLIFKYKKNLNEHMRTKYSTEMKIFKSEECSSTFSDLRV